MFSSSARKTSESFIWALVFGLASSISSSAQDASPPPDKVTLTPHVAVVDKPDKPASFHEDWSEITLKGSTLEAEPPVPGEKDNTPGKSFIRELYQINWRPGDPLDLYVVRPRGVEKPPVVIYLYDYRNDTQRFKDDGWCTRVTEGRVAAIGFVSAFAPSRFHDRPMKQWFVSELPEALATSTHDVRMIINYLETRDDLDTHQIGMLGEGSGATIALLAAAADPRIRAVDVLDPWGDWPDWMAKSLAIPENERPKYDNPEFLEKVKNLDPVAWLPKLKDRHVHMSTVRGFYDVPEEVQKVLEAALPDTAELDLYGNVKPFSRATMGGHFFDWIKGMVQGADKFPPAASATNRHFYPAEKPPASAPGQTAESSPESQQKETPFNPFNR